MTEVTNENFYELLPQIKESFKTASFIAIDTELTGLVSNNSVIPSLFDTIDDRYSKQRISASNFTICQIGISFFSKDFSVNNIYKVHTFSFYLCRRSIGNKLNSFQFDCSAIEFLCDNGFDLNKFAHKGISYLNEIEEEDLRENFKNYLDMEIFGGMENDISSQICDYHVKSGSNHRLESNGNRLECKASVNPLLNYALIIKLRERFHTLWIELSSKNKIVARNVNQSERKTLEDNERNEVESVINSMLGFSIIFKWLVDAKRPIIGHNMFVDLLFIYRHFYRPLPKKYRDYKESIHGLFPYIFDTKSVLFNERKNLKDISHITEMRSLADIYKSFIDNDFVKKYSSSPKVDQFQDKFQSAISTFSPHDAGFDAFATGFVFINIGYMLTLKDKSKWNNSIAPNWIEILKSVEQHCNKINLIRANLHYICLDTSDPPSIRPQWLYAEKRSKNSKFSLTKLSSTLSTHGCADIKPIGANKALIAVNTYKFAKLILDIFKGDEHVMVTSYNIYKHNPYVRSALWSTFALSTYFTIFMTLKLVSCFKR